MQFDTELRTLVEDIEEKMQAASDAEILFYKLEHEVQDLPREGNDWPRCRGDKPQEAVRVERGAKPAGDRHNHSGCLYFTRRVY